PLATVTTALNTLETAVQEAMDGGKIAIASRNAARAQVLSLLRQLSSYVQNNCGNDLVALLSSGFENIKPRSPAGVLPPPQNLRLALTGTSGELSLRLNAVVNARNYSVQQAENPEGPWRDRGAYTNARGILLKGLTPGTVYWVRACANGSAGPSGWGGPVSRWSSKRSLPCGQSPASQDELPRRAKVRRGIGFFGEC
ncbi:MAG TPA: fibronectin type III domain-containing protein, partial [Chthoniobacterales bacterium]|nr:fibronectin type III domain-containing protein [Chthoniobacterales bacterium]